MGKVITSRGSLSFALATRFSKMEEAESLVTGLPQPLQYSLAARANSSLRWSFSSVMVPTVEREVRTGLVWSMAIAGGMPSTASTWGFSILSWNLRAYRHHDAWHPPTPPPHPHATTRAFNTHTQP